MEENLQTSKLTTSDFTKIIRKHSDEYRKASRKEKTTLLSHLEVVTLRSRDSIARTLRQVVRPKAWSSETSTMSIASGTSGTRGTYTTAKGNRGRPPKYSPEVIAALERIWKAYNCPCAERLHGEIGAAIAIFQRDGMWEYSEAATKLLMIMPVDTMRTKLVALAKKHHIDRGISTTTASLLKDLVPTTHGDWDDKPLGYGQIDSVVHAGGELYGDMVYTISFIDMRTYWQEFVAQYTKTAEVTLVSIETIEKRLPFPLTGLHPDSGDEFLNWLLFDWCRNRDKHNDHKILLERSRPSKKNDNCHVEERNKAIVREYVGYRRYDCVEAVEALNELYGALRLYVNFFQPIMKFKQRKKTKNGKWKRTYTTETPLQRVLRCPEVDDDTKRQLLEQYCALNPERLLAKIKALTLRLEKAQQEHYSEQKHSDND